TLGGVGAGQRQAERSGGQSWKRTTGTGGRPSFVSTIAHLTRRCAAPRRAHVLGLWGSDRVLLCGSVTLWPKWSPELRNTLLLTSTAELTGLADRFDFSARFASSAVIVWDSHRFKKIQSPYRRSRRRTRARSRAARRACPRRARPALHPP